MRAATGDEADVLGTDAPERGRRPSAARVAAACAAAVLAAAVVLLLRPEPAPARPVEVFGSMSLTTIVSRPVASPYADRQERDGTALGTVRLELPDRPLQGDAHLEFGASLEDADSEDVVTHAWGSVRLRFGSVSCRGSFGWSNFVEPLEGGGSLHARCEDGATLMARLVATPQPQDTGVRVDLEDGWWTPGA